MKMLKLLQEMKGLAELTRKPASPKAPALFLMDLSARAAARSAKRRKIIIPVKAEDTFDFPEPVKITFLSSKSAA